MEKRQCHRHSVEFFFFSLFFSLWPKCLLCWPAAGKFEDGYKSSKCRFYGAVVKLAAAKQAAHRRLTSWLDRMAAPSAAASSEGTLDICRKTNRNAVEG